MIVVLFEANAGVRQIFLDGRPAPSDDPQPWRYGYSRGRWEGDTLVVETTNFRDDGWLDVNGAPLSAQGKLTERFRRPTFGGRMADEPPRLDTIRLPSRSTPMHLFDNLDSGNGYKVRLLLAQLGISYQWTNLDLDRGETRKPEFLKRNPNGRIPTLELDDGTNLAESNAILWYLAEGTQFVPNDRVGRAQVLQWMFFEQYSHEPYVATPRFIVKHLDAAHPRVAELPDRLAKGRAALAVMNGHLAKHRFFVAGQYSIADIALYAYTHVADEGGHDLSPYPHINAWLRLVASQPRHVTLPATPKAA